MPQSLIKLLTDLRDRKKYQKKRFLEKQNSQKSQPRSRRTPLDQISLFDVEWADYTYFPSRYFPYAVANLGCKREFVANFDQIGFKNKGFW